MVIPAYNEELVIGSVVLKACTLVRKVIVVDDGSHDRTAEVAKLAYAGNIGYCRPQSRDRPAPAGG